MQILRKEYKNMRKKEWKWRATSLLQIAERVVPLCLSNFFVLFLSLSFLSFFPFQSICVCVSFIGQEKLVNYRNWALARKHDLCPPSPLRPWKLQPFSELFLHFESKWSDVLRSVSTVFFVFIYSVSAWNH